MKRSADEKIMRQFLAELVGDTATVDTQAPDFDGNYVCGICEGTVSYNNDGAEDEGSHAVDCLVLRVRKFLQVTA